MENSRPSFSPSSRWKIGFDVVLRTALVLAVAVMANWLGAKFYKRIYLSEQTRVELSSRTHTLLHSLTNKVEVTLYYDTHDRANFYPDIIALLNAYRDANKNISIRTVDYTRDPAEAMKVKERFNLPSSIASPNAPPAKDLVIFSCGSRHDFVPGAAIIGTRPEQIRSGDPDYDSNSSPYQFRRKAVSFNGEVLFTSKIFSLAHGQPLQAYYLKGHGEASLTDTDGGGYQKFALALAQNDIAVNNLELSRGDDIPADCSLLVIAGPSRSIDLRELDKIETYLAQGGKLMVLFNYSSLRQPTGLEAILKKWGVNVLADYVKDSADSNDERFVFVRNFNPKSFVNPLSELALEMILPRPILKIEQAAADAPQVEPLVTSSEAATLSSDRTVAARAWPLIVSVEQKPVAGAVAPRGSARIVVAGDSYFLDNQFIEAAANRDFLNYSVNWLANREQLLSGISPRPVQEFRLSLSNQDQKRLRWLLLGALPGGVLFFGWLVWLVRRK
jgi:hypothetical protein